MYLTRNFPVASVISGGKRKLLNTFMRLDNIGGINGQIVRAGKCALNIGTWNDLTMLRVGLVL